MAQPFNFTLDKLQVYTFVFLLQQLCDMNVSICDTNLSDRKLFKKELTSLKISILRKQVLACVENRPTSRPTK
jgi:hypothetical protein